MGTVNVTREDLGGNLYAWTVTFKEPELSAFSVTMIAGEEDEATQGTLLLFPLLYAGGTHDSGGRGLGTLGHGGGVNVTRVRGGTLGPISGEVCSRNTTVLPIRPTKGTRQ